MYYSRFFKRLPDVDATLAQHSVYSALLCQWMVVAGTLWSNARVRRQRLCYPR